jgi:hypothetical protein
VRDDGFAAFFRAAYPRVVGQLGLLTGDPGHRRGRRPGGVRPRGQPLGAAGPLPAPRGVGAQDRVPAGRGRATPRPTPPGGAGPAGRGPGAGRAAGRRGPRGGGGAAAAAAGPAGGVGAAPLPRPARRGGRGPDRGEAAAIVVLASGVLATRAVVADRGAGQLVYPGRAGTATAAQLAGGRVRSLPPDPVVDRLATAATAWTDRELLVWDGATRDRRVHADGAAFDPAAGRCRPPPRPSSGTAGSPAPSGPAGSCSSGAASHRSPETGRRVDAARRRPGLRPRPGRLAAAAAPAALAAGVGRPRPVDRPRAPGGRGRGRPAGGRGRDRRRRLRSRGRPLAAAGPQPTARRRPAPWADRPVGRDPPAGLELLDQAGRARPDQRRPGRGGAVGL